MNRAIEEYYKCLDSIGAKQKNEDVQRYQTKLLEQILRQTQGKFVQDLSANILGNAVFDGGVYLASRLINGLKKF